MAPESAKWDPPLFLVLWIDASTQDEAWTTHSDFEVEVAQVQSVGWLVQETPASISICQSRGVEDEAISTVLTIPKPWIQQRIRLD